MAKKYEKTYDINYSDVDPNLNCRITSIINFFCDVGSNQSEVLGDTLEKLIEKNYAWVFYKYDIKIAKYPRYRDKISVTTEPYGFKKFYAYRKYVIKNEKGEILAEATAIFFLINLKRRRPIRIPREEYELYGVDEDLQQDIEMDEIESVDKEENIKEYCVRYSDIDSNGHVNNVNYFEWAIESVNIDIIKEFKISRTKIIFEKETKYGESVRVSCSTKVVDENKIKTIHIIRNNEGQEKAKLELEWEKE